MSENEFEDFEMIDAEFEDEPIEIPNNDIKRRTLVAPWKTIAEFKEVHDCIYGASADANTKKRALDQLYVWHLHRSNMCPAAVLATSVILEVLLQDIEENIAHMQVLYASAFTRFFNYMSSIMQTHNMRTMYETAQELGLQSFVVDLRHMCSHGQQLPPLSLLRSTASYCLEWLNKYYWSVQRDCMREVNASEMRRKEKTEFEADASALLEIFDTAFLCYVKGARKFNDCKKFLHDIRKYNLKCYLENHNIDELQQIFKAVTKELDSLIRRQIAIKDLGEIFIEELVSMKNFFILADEQKLTMLVEITQQFFRMLTQNGLIEDVFNCLILLGENSDIEPDKRRGACFWATQIAKSFMALRKIKQMYKEELEQNENPKKLDCSLLNTDSISKTLRLLLMYSCIDQKRTLLFGDTPQRPRAWIFDRDYVKQRMLLLNEYTTPVFKCLLTLVEPAFSESQLQGIERLMEIYNKPETADNFKKSDEPEATVEKIYTAQDLLHYKKSKIEINNISESKCESDSENNSASVKVNINSDLEEECTQFGIWQVVKDMDSSHSWTKSALGCCPWE